MESPEKLKRKRSTIFDTADGRIVDQVLLATRWVTEAQRILKAENNISVNIQTLRYRKIELEKAKAVLEAGVLRQSEAERKADPKTIEQTVDTFLTLGRTALSIIDIIVEDDNPQKSALMAIQSQVSSVVRRAREFRDGFDHLSEMRWLLNVMEIRISRMLELEMSMGIPMRDNSSNIQIMMGMIKDSIELHQSLGLKPKFGDPKLNININVGGTAGGDGTELQSERFRRLKMLAETYSKASPEQRDALRQGILNETIRQHPQPTEKPVDAQFRDIPK